MISIEILELIAHFLFGSITITVGICINRKLFNNVKSEEHLEKGKIIQRIMKTHSVAQCCAWPFLFVFAYLLELNKNLNLEVIPASLLGYLIILFRFFNSVNGCYGGFNSLIMAISRYILIIYHDSAEAYGIRKLRKLLIDSSIVIPVFIAVLGEALMPMEDVWGSFFVPNFTQSFNQSKGMAFEIPHSSLYQVTNTYLPTMVRDGLKFTWSFILILMHLNVLEGLIYLHIYIYYHR